MTESLAAVRALGQRLAGRAGLLLWRLARVARFETASQNASSSAGGRGAAPPPRPELGQPRAWFPAAGLVGRSLH